MSLLRLLFKPTTEKDAIKKRKELILNMLLVSSFLLALIGSLIAMKNYSLLNNYQSLNPGFFLLITALFVFLMLLSKQGKRKLSAYLLIFSYLLPTLFFSYLWGVDLPQALLLYVLIIVMSGILIHNELAIIVTLFISSYILTLTHLQQIGIISPDIYWTKNYQPRLDDSLMLIITFLLILLVCCLYNQEIEKTVKKLKKSQKALKKERDTLEERVKARTEKIKRMQLEKIGYLYRFAEFGKLAGGILHDLVNPLTALSLNLKKMKKNKKMKNHKYLQEALKTSEKSQALINGIKKQIKKEETKKLFSLNQEIKEVVSLLKYKAKKENVKISLKTEENINLYGDPLKFNQIVLNLIDNAIDSYKKSNKVSKIIKIKVFLSKNKIYLIILDRGKGIKPENLKKIFTPFFSTKEKEENSLGVGLASTKNIIEKDFFGEIEINSEINAGTKISVGFPLKSMKEIKDILKSQNKNFSPQTPERLFTPLEIIKSKQHSQGGWEKDSFYSPLIKSSLILHSLTEIPETPQLKEIKNEALSYLLDNQTGNRLYENIGTTFEVLSSVCRYDENVIEGDLIAKILMILTESETQEGGPYYTNEKTKEKDLATNVNIALFLKTQKVELQPLEKFFDKFLQEDNVKENFYKNPYLTLYKLTKLKPKKEIEDYINNHFPKSNFNQILAYIALGRINRDHLKNINLENFKENLSINPLENALFLELEALVSKTSTNPKNLQNINKKVKLEKEFKNTFYSVLEEINKAPDNLQANLKKILKHSVENKNAREIFSTPLMFYNSLNLETRKNIKRKQLRYLSLINFYIWTSYTLLDKTLDKNYSVKYIILSQYYFKKIFTLLKKFKNKELTELFNQLSSISEKNYYQESSDNWINKNNNIIDLNSVNTFSKVYKKSLVCAFTSLSILILGGYKKTAKHYKQTYNFFNHYLKAKQLLDDLHDWEEDLKTGKLTETNSLILKELKDKGVRAVDINKHQAILNKIFWFKVLPQISKKLKTELFRARKAIENNEIIEKPEQFLLLIKPLEKGLEETHKNYKQTNSFLKTFNKK